MSNSGSKQFAGSFPNRPHIGLFGMYASANLGDTAIQTVVMAELRARRPDVEFIGICLDPEDTSHAHGIPSFQATGEVSVVVRGARAGKSVGSQRNTAHSARQHTTASSSSPLTRALNIDRLVRHLDLLLISGGGQIDDFWGGPYRQPLRLLTWCGFARLRGKPIAAFALGIDDLRSPLSRTFVVRALQSAQYRSFRDSWSLQTLRAIGMNAPAHICPDPAFAFRATVRPAAMLTRGKPKVAISPISDSAFGGALAERYDSYVSSLAQVADTLLSEGVEVTFLCSQIRMDPPAVQRVRERMAASSASHVTDVSTVDEFVSEVSNAHVLIASRLHGIVLGLVSGTPTVAISPFRKARQQMVDVGLEHYCLDLDKLHTAVLLDRVRYALDMRSELADTIVSRVADFRVFLESEFNQLASLIPAS